MKLSKKFICVGVILIISIGVLCACANNKTKFNAEIYDRALNYMKTDYIFDSLIYDTFYYDGGEIRYTDDKSLPLSYSLIIDNEIDFELAFKEFPQNINFEEKILCLYIFRCTVNGRNYIIDNISTNPTLKIEISSVGEKAEQVDDTSMPMMRCIAIVMDRIEMTEVVFVEQ